jgi:hypothetical protein
MRAHILLTPTGHTLFHLLSTAVSDLDRANGPKPRKGRKRATFIEKDLLEHIRATVRSPAFQNEFTVADDASGRTATGRRRIDYVCLDPSISVKPSALRQISATCQVKGPARPTIFKPKTKNYYEQEKEGVMHGIKPDVSKQHERSHGSPQTEHYVFWMIENPDNGEQIDKALARLLARLEADLPSVVLTECARTFVRNDFGELWMFLFRVN